MQYTPAKSYVLHAGLLKKIRLTFNDHMIRDANDLDVIVSKPFPHEEIVANLVLLYEPAAHPRVRWSLYFADRLLLIHPINGIISSSP